jgi:hypothetical protein
MRLSLVHDRDGRILAAALIHDRDDVPPLRPLPGDDQHAAEIEVAEEQRELDLHELCTRFRVDAAAGRPRLVPGDEGYAAT